MPQVAEYLLFDLHEMNLEVDSKDEVMRIEMCVQ